MKSEKILGVRLEYPPEEADDAELIREGLKLAIPILNQRFKLTTPADCRIIIMKDWRTFLLQAAPGSWRAFLWLIVFLQGRRFEETWKVAGGWHQGFGRRKVVGIKPRALLETADRRWGEKIFQQLDTPEDMIVSITCHELTHAFSDHLRLPSWLHEGLATRVVDLCLQKETIRPDTLDMLHNSNLGRITRFNINEKDALLLLYARSYWLVRWLEKEKKETLQNWLVKRKSPILLEQELANLLSVPTGELWDRLDQFLYEYFSKNR